jgi:hypothetical protein
MSRRLAFAIALVSTLVMGVGPAAAIDPIPGTPLPDEGPRVVLADAAVATLPYDLDGDGVRELLVSGDLENEPGFAAVEAWWVDEDGTTERSNQVPLRRGLSVDELYLGPATLQPDENGMIPVRIGEPVQIVTAQRDGREVVLVAAIGVSDLGILPCCLTLWEVEPGGPGEISLDLVADTQAAAVQFAALDLDGDGTDELAVAQGQADSGGTAAEIQFFRWDGDRYARQPNAVTIGEACCTAMVDAGDLDGMPGDELLVEAFIGFDQADYRRLSERDGQLVVEAAEFPVPSGSPARILDLDTGPALLSADQRSVVYLWTWPRDAAPELVATRNHPFVPLAVFGDEESTSVLIGTPNPDVVRVIPGDLAGGFGETTPFGRDTRTGTWTLLTTQISGDLPSQPFFGLVPGGLPTEAGFEEAYFFGGSYVRAAPDRPELATVTPSALLPGRTLAGAVGPEGAWMGILPIAPEAFLAVDPQARVIPAQVQLPPSELALVRTSTILEPEPADGQLSPTFEGMAPDPAHPGDLLIGAGAGDAIIEGPPGTRVLWRSRLEPGETTIGPDGRATIRLLEAVEPDVPDGSGTNVIITALTPAGHAYQGEWRVRIFRQPPRLGIDDEVPILDFNPFVVGQTVPGSTLTINDIEVEVAADGLFAVPVEVGILPTEFRVVATDPVGNQTVQVVSRVWPFDYRQLPFVPIVVLITVAAAGFLYLRRPEGERTRRATDDDSTFEEIGG